MSARAQLSGADPEITAAAGEGGQNADGLELRVLSACTPRQRADRRVGHDRRRSDCDIVLADDGIAARAARIHHDATGWTLTPEDGGAGASRANPPGCPVWLTLAATDAPWIEPLGG